VTYVCNNRSSRTTRSIFWTSLTLFVITVSLSVVFFPHICWRIHERQHGLDNVQGLPYRELPEVKIPDNWIDYSIGSIEIKLPPEVATAEHVIDRTGAGYYYRTATFSIYVADTSVAMPGLQFVDSVAALHPYSDVLTAPRLRLDCLRRSSNDFSWLMTWRQVGYHSFCMTWGQIQPAEFKSIETSFGNTIDKLICFSDHCIEISWQSVDLQLEGFISIDHDQNIIDKDLARRICKSIMIRTAP